MDSTAAESLFMGTECEASGFEALDAVRGMESLDAKAAVERTQAILT